MGTVPPALNPDLPARLRTNRAFLADTKRYAADLLALARQHAPGLEEAARRGLPDLLNREAEAAKAYRAFLQERLVPYVRRWGMVPLDPADWEARPPELGPTDPTYLPFDATFMAVGNPQVLIPPETDAEGGRLPIWYELMEFAQAGRTRRLLGCTLVDLVSSGRGWCPRPGMARYVQ